MIVSVWSSTARVGDSGAYADVNAINSAFVMLATCGKSVLRLDFEQRFSSRRHPPELKRSIVENPQLPIKTEVR